MGPKRVRGSAWPVTERGPRGFGLIGVRAQTSWDIDETRGGPPPCTVGMTSNREQESHLPPPGVYFLQIEELLKAGLGPKLART